MSLLYEYKMRLAIAWSRKKSDWGREINFKQTNKFVPYLELLYCCANNTIIAPFNALDCRVIFDSAREDNLVMFYN